MATNGGAVRDAAARRRRIAERGAERLALITGRAQSTSLSSSPLPPSVVESHHSSTAPSPPSIPRNPDQFPLLDEYNESSLNTDPAIDHVKNDVQITKTSIEPSSSPIKTQSFPNPNPNPNPTTITKQPPPISTSNTSQKSKSQTNLGQTLTPNRLRPAITSTQNTRTYCSIIAAMLVLLSYAGFPILSNKFIKPIILSRPLVLLLLTNITLVVAPILLEKVNREGHRGSLTGEMGGFGMDQIGMALEWGMLMKSGLSALFMDCSVYSVVVVCGISFLQKFGW